MNKRNHRQKWRIILCYRSHRRTTAWRLLHPKMLLIALLATSLSFARADDVGGASGEIGIPENSSISDISALTSGIENAEFKKLVNNVCNQIAIASTNNVQTIAKDVELMILKYNGWDRNTPNYKKKFSNFFNTNSKRFICENQAHRYQPQHIFKRVITMKFYTPILVDFFLETDDDYKGIYDTNVNVLTYDVQTKKNETVLDYIDGILAMPNVENEYNVFKIKELREILVEDFGAKNARNL